MVCCGLFGRSKKNKKAKAVPGKTEFPDPFLEPGLSWYGGPTGPDAYQKYPEYAKRKGAENLARISHKERFKGSVPEDVKRDRAANKPIPPIVFHERGTGKLLEQNEYRRHYHNRSSASEDSALDPSRVDLQAELARHRATHGRSSSNYGSSRSRH